jgi:hypothetical protein
MNIGVKGVLAGVILIFLLGATEINIGVNNQVNTGKIVGGNCRQGDGVIVKERRALDQFKDLAIDGIFAVNITCGKKDEVFISADKNLHSLITAVVRDRKLSLSTTASYCTENSFVVDIVQKEIGKISVDGSSELFVDCKSFANDQLSVELRGSSTMKMNGAVKSFTINLQDSSELDAAEFNAQEVRIQAGDASVARLNVSGKLSGTGTDASEIHYRGQPRVVDVDVQDASEVAAED